MEFYEITDSFKKKLTSKAVKGAKGSVLFLQHLLYKCFLLSSIRLIRNHGLFPTLRNGSASVSPHLATAYKYIVEKDDNEWDNFLKILHQIQLQNGQLTANIKRKLFQQGTYKTKGSRNSIVPFFYILYLHEACLNVFKFCTTGPLLLKKGYYLGNTSNYADKSQRDSLLMTTGDDEENQLIDCHEDCMLEDTSIRAATPEQYAMALLTFVEERAQHEIKTAQLIQWSRLLRKGAKLTPLFKVDLDYTLPVKPSPAKSKRKKSVRVADKAIIPQVTKVLSKKDIDKPKEVGTVSTNKKPDAASGGTAEIEKRKSSLERGHKELATFLKELNEMVVSNSQDDVSAETDTVIFKLSDYQNLWEKASACLSSIANNDKGGHDPSDTSSENLTTPVQAATSKYDIVEKLEELIDETTTMSLMTKLDKVVFEAEMKVTFLLTDDIDKFGNSIVMFKCTEKQLLHSSLHGTNKKENEYWCEELARHLRKWCETAWVSSIDANVASQSNVIVLCKKDVYEQLDFMHDSASVSKSGMFEN